MGLYIVAVPGARRDETAMGQLLGKTEDGFVN